MFAFYNRSKRIGLLLSLLILSEAMGSIRLLFPWGNPSYHGACLLTLGAKSISMKRHRCIPAVPCRCDAKWVLLSLVVFASNCTLASLTIFKYFFALRAGWGRTPLVSLMIRDVSLTCALMFSEFEKQSGCPVQYSSDGSALPILIFALCRLSTERAVTIFLFVLFIQHHYHLSLTLWYSLFLYNPAGSLL